MYFQSQVIVTIGSNLAESYRFIEITAGLDTVSLTVTLKWTLNSEIKGKLAK